MKSAYLSEEYLTSSVKVTAGIREPILLYRTFFSLAI